MKTILTLSFIIFQFTTFAQNATNLNWLLNTDQPDSVAWSASALDNTNFVITVGNKSNAFGNADIYIERVDPWGHLDWSYSFDFQGGNDYGVALKIDPSGNIYVTGTGWNASQNHYDIIVLKFSNSGTFLWFAEFDGGFNLDDIPADIGLITANNKVIVTGGSEGSTSLSDMITVCFNSNNGTFLWSKRYDYANLHDAGAGLNVNQFQQIVVVGASADSTGLFDMLTIKYDEFGNGIDSNRVSQGIGMDEPRAIARDTSGNWLVTGFYQPLVGVSRIVVFKVDTSLNVLWSQFLNPSIGINQPSDMILNDQGTIYITGFVSEPSGGTMAYLTSIDESGGINWERTYKLPNKNLKGLKLSIDSDGGIEVLGEVSDGIQNDLLLIRYLPNGNLFFARTIKLNGDQKATAALADASNHIYVTGQTLGDTNDQFLTLQFEWSVNQMNPVLDTNDKPIYVDDELLIRFNPNEMILAAIDNRDKEFGQLNEFVHQAVIDSMNQFVDFDFGRQLAYKIFRSLTSADSISLSRQGHEVRQPKLWSTLNVQIPTDINKDTLQDSLESLFPLIYYTDLNLFGTFTSSVPNDAYYSVLKDLHTSTSDPRSHVNVESGWEIETGKPNIRVGIIDSGLEWDHDDFQFHGNSVVHDVWDFKTNTSWITNPHADSGSHGTQVAGIIGAVRNNGIGVSGIAGGHDSTNVLFAQQGVSLYGLRILKSATFFYPTLNYVAEAIYYSSLSSGNDYTYGLHLQNHSWGMSPIDSHYTDTNITLLRDAVHKAYRNGVAMFCARGNGNTNASLLPATFDDKWVMTIGGTGTDGDYQNGYPLLGSCEEQSSWGKVDVAAPASACTTQKAITANVISNSYYDGFGGTSGATPHATGAGALLCSYLNNSNFIVAPEDIEWLLQLSATDTYTAGIDDKTGYGRLNIGAALKLVEQPDKKVEHHGTLATSGSVSVSFETTGTVDLKELFETESFQVFQDGLYQMDRYKITAVINHSIDTIDSIIAHWTRNDQVTTFPLPNNGKLTPHEECFITAFSNTQATLVGYVYHVKTLGGTPIGWIPQDTSTTNAVLEYTLLIHPKSAIPIDTTDTTVEDTTTAIHDVSDHGHSLAIYPNPTTNTQQLELNLMDAAEVFHILRNIDGSLIRTQSFGTLNAGKHIFTIDMSYLPAGIYLHEIHLGEERFIKRVTNL